jgi:amidohydrolase
MNILHKTALLLFISLSCSLTLMAQQVPPELILQVEKTTNIIEDEVIALRRDFHQNPELSNQEFRTAAIVAAHLQALGLEVQTGVAGTGVVGLLKGGQAGGVIALRADMDALPITEELDLPFASKVKAMFNGKEVGVMHACGHDVHTSSLMGVATVLASMRDQLPGSVKFIFQPAEEGVFDADVWGAKLMVAEGVLENPRPDAIFGMHVWPVETGTIQYVSGPMMASVDNFTIRLTGRGSHGAMPWDAADPIVAAAQLITSIQTLVSRNSELTKGAAVVSIGSIQGGNRNNIIPDEVVMLGTIRTHNEQSRQLIHQRIKDMANHIAAAHQVSAATDIVRLYPAVINNTELVEAMLPVMQNVVGKDKLQAIDPVMIAEDFSYYANEIPGFFYFMGIVPRGTEGPFEPIHSPRFYVDESAIKIAVKTMSLLALEALFQFEEGKEVGGE